MVVPGSTRERKALATRIGTISHTGRGTVPALETSALGSPSIFVETRKRSGTRTGP